MIKKYMRLAYNYVWLNHTQARTTIVFLVFSVAIISVWFLWLRNPFIFSPEQWGAYTFIPKNGEQSSANLGLWGDSFGALNALLSAFGFLAIILTLIEQQRDQHRQRFDATFFEMLKMLREERASLRFTYSDDYIRSLNDPQFNAEIYRGKNAVRAASREYNFWIRRNVSRIDSLRHDRLALRAFMSKLYISKIHSRYESKLGAYYRVMYTILEKIDSDTFLGKREKERYGNIIRAQMTAYEVQLAAVNGLSDFAKDFPILLQKYHVLKYMRNGKLKLSLVIIYGKKAFMPRDSRETRVEIIPVD